jgi:hypothetical protein
VETSILQIAWVSNHEQRDTDECDENPNSSQPETDSMGPAFLVVSYISAGQQVDIETRTLLPQIS